MNKLNKTDKVLISVFILCFLAISGYIINSGNGGCNIYVASPAAKTSVQTVDVTVSGAVKNPGTYSIEKGESVYNVIKVAGGPDKKADLGGLNMDTVVTSPMHIDVPVLADNSAEAVVVYGENYVCNINTASQEQLSSLQGIGDTIAARIVQYRNTNGTFKTTDEIKNVKGIGDATYERIKEYITVEGE